MREKKLYAVVTFRSTHEAMAMEGYAAKHQVPGRLIPVPASISAGCGLAWRMEIADYERFSIEDTGMGYEKVTEIYL